MKRYFRRASCLALTTLLLLLPPSSQAQAAAEAGTMLAPLETLLERDGSLNLKRDQLQRSPIHSYRVKYLEPAK